MEFRILGPLEIVDDERTLALHGPKQRALLAILLLHANEVVSRDRLIDDLWAERRPETAATALHGYVSQLRKVLEPTDDSDDRMLVTRAPGYELRLGPDQLDLERFDRLAQQGKGALADGDAETAATTLREALALWHGRPLAEFASAPFALVESLRLEELRLSALEDRIEADLALGRHSAVVAELESLVAEHPQRERLCGYLMLALYRSGRQAEALDVYRRTRRALVDELGIEPGTMLQQLERAILNHDSSLELPTQVHDEREPDAVAAEVLARRSTWLRRALAVGAVGLLAVALGAAFALRDRDPAQLLLEPNSVGFIESESSRVTRSFRVGREPSALAVAFDALWVANYRDQTVIRVDRARGQRAAIPVGGHPTGLAAHQGKVWVWTIEGRLVPIDPTFDTAGDPLPMSAYAAPLTTPIRGVGATGGTARSRVIGGSITSGGGFLWIAVPPTTVLRVNPAEPPRVEAIHSTDGARSAIGYGNGDVWVAGYETVYPIATRTGVSGPGIRVGQVNDLTFDARSLWVVSGRGDQGIHAALRRVDLRDRVVEQTIPVGSDPLEVAFAAGAIWVASGSDRAIRRVDPAEGRVVVTIPLGARPTALADDADGIWVAVG